MECVVGGKVLRLDLETLTRGNKFNSSESVFWVKKVGDFLSHEGGGQRSFHISHKKVVFFKGSLSRMWWTDKGY